MRLRGTSQAPQLDRRELLGLGGAAALALALPDSIAAAGPRSAATTIVLADPRYADSLGFARGLARSGATMVPLAPNAGAAWFGGVAPRMRSGWSVAGLTLDSDFFIMQRLAEPARAVTRFVGCHDWRCHSGATHKLRGRIDLDGIDAALAGGDGQWAERLAAALTMAAERGDLGREICVRRNHATPRTNSPRYVVSWLLTATAGPNVIG
jgi:hypothetical protein